MEPSPSTSPKRSDPAPAVLWTPLGGGAVRCGLCAHRCRIAEGAEGICRVRVNSGGALFTLVKYRLVAAHVDPIEKKPLFHFLPGTTSYSIATAGCNFRCDYCQNWAISQAPRLDAGEIPGEEVRPADVVTDAVRRRCASVSCTYTEPTVYFETAEAVGTLARGAGLKTVFVTNGYLTPEAAARAASFLDAANVDLKGFNDRAYRRVCGATLKGVLTGLEALLAGGVWVEVTTLVVPGLNDSEAELSALAAHLAGLGRHIPWHVSRFHPDFRREATPPTPEATLERVLALGRAAGLHHVYVGNLPGHAAESTRCPSCETMVIERAGFRVLSNRLAGGRCPACGTQVRGVWDAA